MNKLWKRILSLILVFCMLLPYGRELVYGAEKAKEPEDYRKGVIERYDEYRNGDYNYKYLTERDNYSYCAWTDAVYEMTTWDKIVWDDSKDKSFWEKFKKFSNDLDRQAAAELRKIFTWTSHVLTGTNLNKEAYIRNLSNIIAMHEKGFLETAASQAEYTITVNAGSEVQKILENALNSVEIATGKKFQIEDLKLKDLMNKKQAEKIEKAYKTFAKRYKLVKQAWTMDKALTEEIENAAEAIVLANYLSLYEERTVFLEVLLEESKPGSELHKAVQVMMEASDMRVLGLIMADPVKRAEHCLNLSSYGATEFKDFADELMEYITAAAGTWMAKYSKKMAATFLTGMKMMTTSVALVTVGTLVGGSLGRIAWGDEYEMIREMLIMDEIGEILSKEVVMGDQRFLSLREQKEQEKNYQNLVNHVSVAECLCYVRLRGEYCVTEFTKLVNDSESGEEWDIVYEQRDSRELKQAYQALAAIFPEPQKVENNGGRTVGYQGNVYYWKYSADSFYSDGLFASYNYQNDTENQLICRDRNGNETVLLTAKGNGPIFISGDRLYLKADHSNVFSVNLSGNDRVDHGSMEIWAADEQEGTLIVKKNNAEGDSVCLLEPNHNQKTIVSPTEKDPEMPHPGVRQYVEMLSLGVIDGYCYFSKSDTAAKYPSFAIYRIPLDGSEVTFMASVDAEEDFAFGLNACQLMKAGEKLYYSYGYYAGTGGFFQNGGINCMDINGENEEVCVPYGELASEDFFVREQSYGETGLYYIAGEDASYFSGEKVNGSYIGFWDDYPYRSCYVKTRKEGEKNWQTTQKSLNISRSGSYICVGGEILQIDPETMEYKTLIPKEAGFAFIDQPGQGVFGTEQQFPLISQLDVVGDEVYFIVDWNEATGENMGWRPGYRRLHSAFYSIKIGEKEAKELYSY